MAADADFLYAINNHAIGKYDKKSGEQVAHWDCENAKPLIHLDLYAGSRYVNFAHYRTDADEADRDPRWTTLIQYDNEWRQRQAWVYPAEVVSKLGVMSISGGVFGRDGRLYTTGHDNPEIYVFSFPKGGSTLVLEETIPMPMHGQGIAFDPVDPTLFYGIDRPKKEIVVTRIG